MGRVRKNYMSRIHPELLKKANLIRARCILEGRKLPTMTEITKAMARQIQEELLWDEFIRL